MKHGMYKTKTYMSWICIHRRCRDTNWHCHHNYKDKGITVCPQWVDFLPFYLNMGERPLGHTLDRIDNSKGYYKENCRWATPLVQGANRDLPKQNSNNKSGYVGIHWDKERNLWFAQVRRNNITKALGRFTYLEDAIHVREQYLLTNYKK